MPRATALSRRARIQAPDEVCRAQPVSVSRIVFILFKYLADRQKFEILLRFRPHRPWSCVSAGIRALLRRVQ
jgi:hypothetical protein